MAELRKHPLTNDWIMIASHRQGRPQMPKDYCPFCPGSGKVPEAYDVYKYDNDFPALSPNPPAPDDVATDFFETAPCYGKCEVILYSPEHTVTLPELPTSHIVKLVNHGQIYGYPFLPKKLELEVENARAYRQEKGRCLFCDMLDAELADGRRVIFRTAHFTVFLPFFSEYPYGVYIMSNAHRASIAQLTPEEREDLAEVLRRTTGMLDSLFGFKFPYMMCMYNEPVNGEDLSALFHFHIAFYPPMRSADKIKYNASSETGAWAHCNPTCPEETSQELRAAYERFMNR